MNSETDHVGAYLMADRVVGSMLDSASAGIVLSIDIGGSLFDAVARNAARSSVHQFVSCPSLVRYRSLVRGRSVAPRTADIVDEPVLFGRVDGFMQSYDRNETFESYGPLFEEVSTRSIDGWASGRPPIRLIHFGDPDLVLEQMGGATGALAKDRPLATVYVSRVDQQKLLSLLERHAYRAVDLRASTVQPGASRDPGDFGWIAVPSERSEEFQSTFADFVRDGFPQFSEWNGVMDRNATVRQRRSRSVFGLPANALSLDRRFTASDIVVEDDCYPVESDGVSSWRWLGPRSRTRLILPCALPGIYEVEIFVIASHLRNGLSECRVLVDGREVRATIHGADQGTVRFIGQLEAGKYAGFMTVDLVSPGAVLPVGADPRALRLNVQSISVSPWR
jgi:hypothetical protein